MIIDVPKVSTEGSEYSGEEPIGILDLESARGIRVDGPVTYGLRVEVVSGELVVRGRVGVPMGLQCSRCGEFFSTSVEDSSFLRAYDVATGVETVDLTPDLREAILLQLPGFPLCSPECRGLCPVCGANLNQGSCACAPPSGGDRWHALEGLALPSGGEGGAS